MGAASEAQKMKQRADKMNKNVKENHQRAKDRGSVLVREKSPEKSGRGGKAPEKGKAKGQAKNQAKAPPKETPYEKETRIAVEKLQVRYRRSIVVRNLQEAPTDGAWALCKALRNEQAVRDYKVNKERQEMQRAIQLQEAYRGCIADKILEMEDKSFAMQQQAKCLERVFMWESLVGNLLADVESSRIGLMKGLVIDVEVEEKRKEEEKKKAEEDRVREIAAKAKAKSKSDLDRKRRKKKKEKKEQAVD